MICRNIPQLPITADKREIKDLPKLPSATSFIRRTLSEMSGCWLLGMFKCEKTDIVDVGEECEREECDG